MSQELTDIPFADWNDDMTSTFALQSQLAASKEGFPEEFHAMFEHKYPNPAIHHYRQTRIEHALRWFEAHRTELEDSWPSDIVSGDGALLLSNRVVIALYAIYSQCPENRLSDDFPISAFAQAMPS